LKVAARVEISARRLLFHLAGNDPYAERFRAVREHVMNPAIPETAGAG
jgi:hypothetical protein